jgi:flagellar biosynthesis protein FlhB
LLTGIGSVLAVAVLLAFAGPAGWNLLTELAREIWSEAGAVNSVPGAMVHLSNAAEVLTALACVPAMVAAAAAATLSFVQVGALWAPGAVAPDASRLRWRGLDGPGLLVGFVVAAVIVLLAGSALADALPVLARVPYDEVGARAVIEAQLWALGAQLLGACVVLAGIDFLWVRQRYAHSLMMTRAEWVRERRLSYGDPELRRARSRLRRELSHGGIKLRSGPACDKRQPPTRNGGSR